MPTDNDSNGVALADHRVHFFDTDDGLVAAVGSYLTAAVLEGDGVVIIATPAHRARFEQSLVGAGIDVDVVRDGGRLQMLDAAETLASFRTDGRLDGAAFEALVGDLVRGTAETGRHVRAYGEMVALLWEAGDVAAAIELERLWNRLGEHLTFALFCAYPLHLFADSATATSFAEVCQLHTEVVEGAPTPADFEVMRRFPRSTQTPRLARQFACDTLRTWSIAPELLADAVLVLSELVTNAVRHAWSDVAVGIDRTGDGIRITVSDACGDPPVASQLVPDALGGRGLAMVDALTQAWGYEFVGTGKMVWADLNSTDWSDR